MNDHFQHPLSEVSGINFSRTTLWPWQLDNCVILSQISQSIFFLILEYSCFTVLASVVQWSESAICTHKSLPVGSPSTTASHPSRPSQSAQLSSLPYAAGSHQLFSLHVALHIRQLQSPSASLHCPQGPHVRSLCLHLYSCPANGFICIIFLGPIHMCSYTIFVFLFLTYFTLYDRL